MDIGPREVSEAALKQRVFLERMNMHYRSLLLSNSTVVVNTLLMALVLQTPDNQTRVFFWTGATLLVALYRFLSAFRYRRQDAEQREAGARGWYRELMVGVALSGATWGAAGFLLYDPSDAFNQSFLAFIMAGMCAGAIISLSAFVEAAAVFLVLSLLPFLLRLLEELSRDTTIMAIMVVLYLAMMLVFARRAHRTVLTGLEMTYLRSEAEAKVEQQALYDELTGLPNRRLLRDRLDRAVARNRRHGGQTALFFLDLDYFKRVNDSLGHGIGDLLLVEVARRISTLLREEDTAARLGGDEFVALLTGIRGDTEQALSLVQRRGDDLRRAVEAPMSLSGNEVHITVSMGVSLLPGDAGTVDELLKHADTAMYRAKDEGRNTLRFFVPEMQRALLSRIDMEKRLRESLDSGSGLSLYLQPQHNRDGSVCGAELLLRWEQEDGFVSPSVFIPVAEDSGLIFRLGDWVVEEACRIAEHLLRVLGDATFSVAFNVSPRQFRQKTFTQTVLKAIETHRLPPGIVELELTERLLIDDVDDTVAKMQSLRESGLRFSIDDFGTGYSSLSYLKSLPLDTLKIDQSFVAGVLNDPGDASIVRAIISVAHTLQLDVIAEGVESASIREFLTEAGCYRFQGYLYAPPMPLEEFLAHVQAQSAQGGGGDTGDSSAGSDARDGQSSS